MSACVQIDIAKGTGQRAFGAKLIFYLPETHSVCIRFDSVSKSPSRLSLTVDKINLSQMWDYLDFDPEVGYVGPIGPCWLFIVLRWVPVTISYFHIELCSNSVSLGLCWSRMGLTRSQIRRGSKLNSVLTGTPIDSSWDPLVSNASHFVRNWTHSAPE